MSTWTTEGWCPPAEDSAPEHRWTTSFEHNGEWWGQADMLGSSPAGADLGRLLRDWFEDRGGPGVCWRLQVTPRDETDQVLASFEQWFEEYQRPVQKLRRTGGLYA
ncbi:hypothetical protein AB0F91_46415 [Amycolatopsis sp. NPDC023774]|uniref:hypothetical protein n=1 Tax=Amycolatopsis sp. NPDC023774 TaxID=3155015 RepID=UPI0033E855BA